MNERILLVIDSDYSGAKEIVSVVTNLKNNVIIKGNLPPLDYLSFCEDGSDNIKKEIESIWGSRCEAINTAQMFERVDYKVRESLRDLGKQLREKLDRVAYKTGGSKWSKKFGHLWWLTELSTKNSPGEPFWWDFFRVATVNLLLEEKGYFALGIIGRKSLVKLGKQLSEQHGISCYPTCTSHFHNHFFRLVAARLCGCITLLIAIVMARLKARGFAPHSKAISSGTDKPVFLAYTWYPRVWTQRFGVWQDMYYGRMADLMEERFGLRPTWVLRLYDRTKFLSPKIYWRRLKMLGKSDSSVSGQALILEAFGNVGETICSYFDFREVFHYWRMTRHRAFAEVFRWEGLDVRPLLAEHMLRSVFVSWPHLKLLNRRVKRISEKVRPKAVILYCFEFVYGRAIINGTKKGCPTTKIIGMQHGPIAPMKLLYAGSPSELSTLGSGSEPCPQPDVYCLDGKVARNIMAEQGIPFDTMRITGAARFDSVWQRRNMRVDGRKDKVRVLIAPGLHDTRFVLTLALSGLQNDSRFDLIIKPHPKVSTDFVAALVRTLGNENLEVTDRARLSVVREGDIYHWMTQSDIFLATYSSTGVEAIAFGLPVILLVPSSIPDMSLFRGQQVPILTAHSGEQLYQHVQKLIGNPEDTLAYVKALRPILIDSFGEIDGRASFRLAKVCAELAGFSNGVHFESGFGDKRDKITG